MSVEAITWAWKQPVESQSELLVLLALSDSASSDTFECWPSYKFLATKSKCSVATVKRSIKRMVAAGLIKVAARFHEHEQQSNLYTVLVAPPVHPDTPPGVHSEPPVHQCDPTPVHTGDPTSGHQCDPTPVHQCELQNRHLTVKNRNRTVKGSASKRCPSTWQPRQADIDTLLSEFPTITVEDIRRWGRSMTDYEFKSAKKDWDAVFRNWIRTEAERNRRSGKSKTRQQIDAGAIAAQEFIHGRI